MAYISLFIFWLIGLIISSFTIIPIFIILFFGIPLTNKLTKYHLLDENNTIINRYFISIIILSVTFIIVLFLIYTFFQAGLIGFIIGGGMSLFFGLGQVGTNKNNVTDYFETNKKFLKGSLEEVLKVI